MLRGPTLQALRTTAPLPTAGSLTLHRQTRHLTDKTLIMMNDKQIFKQQRFTPEDLEEEYFGCSFVGCDFSGSDLGDTLFEECVFQNCNFAMSLIRGSLREVSFEACKLTGADFSGIAQMSNTLSFKKCRLEYAVFADIRLPRLLFDHCDMSHSVFNHADITASRFAGCNLAGASFVGTNLERADFSQAYNYTINPSECRLRKTVFSEYGLRGLVDHLDIIIK